MVGGLVRSMGNSAIWNPRDGYWYRYWRKDRPAPFITEPTWMTRMNRELDAIEQNTRMFPRRKATSENFDHDAYTSGNID